MLKLKYKVEKNYIIVMKHSNRKPVKQIYSNYTEEDFKVWKILYLRQIKFLKGNVVEEFFEGLKNLDFNAEEIPNFKEVNKKLKILTGWQLKTVPNIAEPKEFFLSLSERKFTSTCWLRSFNEIDYLAEPDMFHDVFAHVPMLTNKSYTYFFQKIGEIALKFIDNSNKIERLQRLYWHTIEFGLMKTNFGIKAYGAGIISSYEEMKNIISIESIKESFNVDNVLNENFRIDKVQKKYFIINSFEQLVDSLKEVEIKI